MYIYTYIYIGLYLRRRYQPRRVRSLNGGREAAYIYTYIHIDICVPVWKRSVPARAKL